MSKNDNFLEIFDLQQKFENFFPQKIDFVFGTGAQRS